MSTIVGQDKIIAALRFKGGATSADRKATIRLAVGAATCVTDCAIIHENVRCRKINLAKTSLAIEGIAICPAAHFHQAPTIDGDGPICPAIITVYLPGSERQDAS